MIGCDHEKLCRRRVPLASLSAGRPEVPHLRRQYHQPEPGGQQRVDTTDQCAQVLTAAHCVDWAELHSVIAGAHRQDTTLLLRCAELGLQARLVRAGTPETQDCRPGVLSRVTRVITNRPSTNSACHAVGTVLILTTTLESSPSTNPLTSPTRTFSPLRQVGFVNLPDYAAQWFGPEDAEIAAGTVCNSTGWGVERGINAGVERVLLN